MMLLAEYIDFDFDERYNNVVGGGGEGRGPARNHGAGDRSDGGGNSKPTGETSYGDDLSWFYKWWKP